MADEKSAPVTLHPRAAKTSAALHVLSGFRPDGVQQRRNNLV
jgi:hypothetical protein